jgi:hypothetical protein
MERVKEVCEGLGSFQAGRMGGSGRGVRWYQLVGMAGSVHEIIGRGRRSVPGDPSSDCQHRCPWMDCLTGVAGGTAGCGEGKAGRGRRRC